MRTLYIADRERTLERKLKEACLAIKLSEAWSKNRILTAYLNHVYYGNRAYGVEAAAQTYFSRRARNLNLNQSALLAGLTQAPSAYDPIDSPERALNRRDAVLRAMLENGSITRREYRRAFADRDLGLKPGTLYSRIREPYFFSFVREQLVDRYGERRVQSGGLRVYTTIDPRLQRLAEQAIRDTLYYPDDPASAVVSIDPRTGAIRAMTGVIPGRSNNQFNLAAQARRQAGSTFKTFVLTTAVARGIDPSSTSYLSAPFHYEPSDGSEDWDVSTYSHSYLGTVSIESATLASDNTVYARLTLDLGPGQCRRHGPLARGADAAPRCPPSGSSRSRCPRSTWHRPTRRWQARGSTRGRARSRRSCSPVDGSTSTGASRIAARDLGRDRLRGHAGPRGEHAVGDGTAAAIGRPAAGKTGTTDDHADAWFCGYTPDLATTVWVG